MNDRFSADDLPRRRGSSPWPVDLAHARPFRLGATEVRPAARELLRGGQRETLEPLVMQVLVALANARGEILSRDDLIDACWGGRAITDDAINRVMSRLRALARAFGGFEIETITKVGYRLIREGNEEPAAPRAIQRRDALIAGGAAAALGAVAFGTWRWLRSAPPPDQAALLLQKGMNALQNNDALETQDPGSSLEAIALLTDATQAAPNSAVAWGALAMAYAVRKRTVPLAERPGMAARSRAAARRSLQLDPTEGRALGALRMLDPVYRNWARVERADREALARNPRFPILLFLLSDMLGTVGRFQEALSFSRQHDRTKFLIPGADRKFIIDLWASGDLQGADHALDVAVRQWPQNAQIWRTRLTYLMFSGRPLDVLAILRNPADRPLELRPEYFDAVRVTAEALAGKRPPHEAVDRGLAYLKTNPSAALPVAQAMVALNAAPTAFDLLDGYYFGEGSWSVLAPEGGDQDRVTNHLFHPVMSSVWQTPEFARLVQRIGLEDYWRESGTVPDYRRPA
jgi:DNA-binding winged helix-turn-helix (wHTH) protein